MSQTIGVLPLGRPTFDVAFAEQTLAKAFAALDATDHRIVGPRALLFDAEATGAALEALSAQGPDLLLILQVTFTDASITVAAATRPSTRPWQSGLFLSRAWAGACGSTPFAA